MLCDVVVAMCSGDVFITVIIRVCLCELLIWKEDASADLVQLPCHLTSQIMTSTNVPVCRPADLNLPTARSLCHYVSCDLWIYLPEETETIFPGRSNPYII